MTWEELISNSPFRFIHVNENKTIELPFCSNMLTIGLHKGGSISIRVGKKFFIIKKKRSYEQMLAIMEALI